MNIPQKVLVRAFKEASAEAHSDGSAFMMHNLAAKIARIASREGFLASPQRLIKKLGCDPDFVESQKFVDWPEGSSDKPRKGSSSDG